MCCLRWVKLRFIYFFLFFRADQNDVVEVPQEEAEAKAEAKIEKEVEAKVEAKAETEVEVREETKHQEELKHRKQEKEDRLMIN